MSGRAPQLSHCVPGGVGPEKARPLRVPLSSVVGSPEKKGPKVRGNKRFFERKVRGATTQEPIFRAEALTVSTRRGRQRGLKDGGAVTAPAAGAALVLAAGPGAAGSKLRFQFPAVAPRVLPPVFLSQRHTQAFGAQVASRPLCPVFTPEV